MKLRRFKHTSEVYCYVHAECIRRRARANRSNLSNWSNRSKWSKWSIGYTECIGLCGCIPRCASEPCNEY